MTTLSVVSCNKSDKGRQSGKEQKVATEGRREKGTYFIHCKKRLSLTAPKYGIFNELHIPFSIIDGAYIPLIQNLRYTKKIIYNFVIKWPEII